MNRLFQSLLFFQRNLHQSDEAAVSVIGFDAQHAQVRGENPSYVALLNRYLRKAGISVVLGLMTLQAERAVAEDYVLPEPIVGPELDSAPLTHMLICRRGQLYRVPISTDLRVAGLRDGYSLCAVENNCTMNKQPIYSSGFGYRIWNNGGREKRPILEVILGRESPYKVSALAIGNTYGKFEEIEGPMSRVRKSGGRRSGITAVPERARLFGNRFKVDCTFGPPVYSKDPNSYVCTLYGGAVPDLRVMVDFHTGSDLPGHWPMPPEGWDNWDFSSWAAPLAEVETAIHSMRITSGDVKLCN